MTVTTSRPALPVRNPRTGLLDAQILPADAATIDALASRLRAAQPEWQAMGPQARGECMRALADAIERNEEALLAALAADTGRLALSRMEIGAACGMLRRWAGIAPELMPEGEARRASASPGVELAGRSLPYPLVGAISPWNFPLLLAMIDAVPALSAGCAVIVKPSEVTPRFIAPLRDAIRQVPAIDAVFAVVEGDGATGAALVEEVDYLCFTGSVATGRKVAETAAPSLVPVSLELGGKDPLVVLAGSDPRTAARIALRASCANAGQACQSIEHVIVHRSLEADFLDALVREAEEVTLNAGDISNGTIGPFIHAPQAWIVQAQIDEAVAAGASVLCGGMVEEIGGGLWLRPTVLTGCTRDMAILREETFGPVLPVTPFDSEDEAAALANAGDFGLSAAIIGRDADSALRFASRIEAGAVSIMDAGLTTSVWDAEKSAFGISGIGPSRMGAGGLLRFLRRQAFIIQTGTPQPLAAYGENAPPDG